MDDAFKGPLTVVEAKARLRDTLDRRLPGGYVRRHPLVTLSVAVLVGYILGRHPHGHQIMREVAKRLL